MIDAINDITSQNRHRLLATLDEFRDINVHLPDNVTELTFVREAFTITNVQPNEYITTISCDQEAGAIQPSVAEGNCTVEISSGLNRLISNDTAATIRVSRGVFGCNPLIEGGRNTTQRLSHSLFLRDGLVLFESSDVTQRSWVILSGVVLPVSININGKEGKLQSVESPCASQLIEAYNIIPVPKVGSYIRLMLDMHFISIIT